MDWVAQDKDNFDIWIVVVDPLHCGRPIAVNRCVFPRDQGALVRPKVSVQEVIIDGAGKQFVVIKKMRLLADRESDLRMRFK